MPEYLHLPPSSRSYGILCISVLVKDRQCFLWMLQTCGVIYMGRHEVSGNELSVRCLASWLLQNVLSPPTVAPGMSESH